MIRTITTTAMASLVFIGLGTSQSFAWGNGGHMATAIRAWDAMTPAARTSAIALIKQHPRYNEDILGNLPPGLSPEDQNLWLFAFYATWPDYISQTRMRTIAPAAAQLYPHSAWHTIGLPVSLDPARQLPFHPAPPSGDPNKYRVLDALPRAIAQLDNTNLPPADRAVALAWVMHLVGDLHEPCHCASLISKRFPAPDGDHVAVNLKITMASGQTTGLHQYWDSLYCAKEDLPSLKAWEAGILADPSLAPGAFPELKSDASVSSWVNESYQKAQQDVYTSEIRAAVAAQETDPKAPWKTITLSDAYKTHAEQIARRAGTLAGLRLAETLDQVSW